MHAPFFLLIVCYFTGSKFFVAEFDSGAPLPAESKMSEGMFGLGSLQFKQGLSPTFVLSSHSSQNNRAVH